MHESPLISQPKNHHLRIHHPWKMSWRIGRTMSLGKSPTESHFESPCLTVTIGGPDCRGDVISWTLSDFVAFEPHPHGTIWICHGDLENHNMCLSSDLGIRRVPSKKTSMILLCHSQWVHTERILGIGLTGFPSRAIRGGTKGNRLSCRPSRTSQNVCRLVASGVRPR